MRSVITLLILASLVGCASTRARHYQETVDKWVGQPKDHLIEKWGVPSRAVDLDGGKKVFQYDEVNGSSSAIMPVSGYGYIAKSKAKYCTTVFFLDANGIVEKTNWDGNDCH